MQKGVDQKVKEYVEPILLIKVINYSDVIVTSGEDHSGTKGYGGTGGSEYYGKDIPEIEAGAGTGNGNTKAGGGELTPENPYDDWGDD